MDWRNQLVFLAVLLLIHLIGESNGALDSSPAITYQFGQCMVENLKQSTVFSADDRDDISSVSVILNDGLRRVTDNESGYLLNKVLLSAFITSLCEIALNEEFASIQYRRQELLFSAEKCSISVMGTADANIFREINRIFFALRGSRFPVSSTGVKANTQGTLPSGSLRGVQPSLPQHTPVRPMVNPQTAATSFPYSAETPLLPSFPPEEFIENILQSSPIFGYVFHPKVSNQDAISIARAVTEKSMAGFNPIVINDALNVVANAILTRSPNWTPRDFAIAIGRSINGVIKHYGLPLSSHVNRIGNIMIADLQAHFENTRFANGNSQGQQAQMQEPTVTGDSTAQFVQSRPNPAPLAIITIPSNDQTSFIMQESNNQNHTAPTKDMITFTATDLAGDSTSGEKFSSATVDKEFVLSQCLLMARNALSPYGQNAINNVEYEIKTHFQSIPNGSPYPIYAEAFSSALVNTLVSQNLMGSINPEQLSKAMLEVLNSQDASSDIPTKVEMQAPEILPAPVALEEPRPGIPSSSGAVETEFINSQGVSMTEAPLVPMEDTSLKSIDASRVETQLETSSAISETDMLTSGNQQKELEILPINIDILVGSTVMPLNTTADVPQNSSMVDNYPLQDMFPTTTFDSMNGFTKFSEFPFTVMLPEIESSKATPGENFNNKTALNVEDEDQPEASKALENQETQVSGAEANNKQAEHGSETLRDEFASEVSETLGKEKQLTDINQNPTDSFLQNNSSSVELQPSFQPPMEHSHANTEDYEGAIEFTESPEMITDYELEDPTVVLAREIVSISSSAISYIRTGIRFDLNELCANLNRLAPIVDIPPLTYCSEIALIDYILNIMMEVTRILRNI